MKQAPFLPNRVIYSSVLFVLCAFADISGATVSSGGRRMWEIAVDTKETTDTVESKVCELEIAADQDFLATFTVIDAINRKVATANSKVDIIDSILDQLDLNQLQTILSKVDVVDQESMSLCDAITIVSVDDFGGTWTALDALGDDLCEKFDTVFDAVDTLESSIDQLIADNATQFTATVTKLEILQINVVDSMIKVQNLADQLDSDLNELDSLIDIVKNDFSTIESKVDVLDLSIEQSFAGTFTAIEALFAKVCEVDNKVDQLDVAIETACVNTFSSLEAVEEKICLADSKIDTLNDLLEILKGKASIIDEPLIVDCSLVDALLMDLQTVNSSLDIVATKVAGITSRVDLVDMLAATALDKLCTSESIVDQVEVTDSLIDTINNTFVTIDSKVEVIDITLSTDTIESKLCIAESKVETIDNQLSAIYSHLELIDTIAQDADSVIDEVDITVASLESKICIIDEQLDTLDSSVDVVCNHIDAIESKSDAIDDVLLSVLDSIQSTESSIDRAVQGTASLASTVFTVESKLCTIDSSLITIDSSVDIVSNNLAVANNEVDEGFVSFDATWTSLSFYQDKLCIVDSKVDGISSILDTKQLDIGTTFTAIEAVLIKACNVEEGSQLQLDRACVLQGSLMATFTTQDEILDKLCNTSSQLDELSFSTTLLDPLQNCVGTPIRQSDVGTTGFTILTSGRYYLAENITFSPVGIAFAITISADNVYLDLNGKTMQQGNAVSTVEAIRVTGTRSNISIVNGIIDGFEGGGVTNVSQVNPITGFLLEGLIIRNIGSGAGGVPQNGIMLSMCSDGVIRRCAIRNTENACLELFNNNSVFISDSYFIGSNASSGVYIEVCRQLLLDNCVCTDNALNGLVIADEGSDIILKSSSFSSNAQDGISTIFTPPFDNVVIKNNVIQSNGRYGINLADGGTITRNCIINNDIVSNVTAGVRVDGNAVDNTILFNRLIQNGTNITMAAADGANTVLGNFAYNSGGDAQNYNLSTTTVNRVIISQSGSFPTTIPTYWHNISMIP